MVGCLPAMKVDYDQVAPSTQTPQDTFPLSQPENQSYILISSPDHARSKTNLHAYFFIEVFLEPILR